MNRIVFILVSSFLVLSACSREEGFSKEYRYHDKPACELDEGGLIASLSNLDTQLKLRNVTFDGETYNVQMPAEKDVKDIMQQFVWDASELHVRKSQHHAAHYYEKRRQAILQRKNSQVVGSLSERDGRCQ